MNRKVLLLLTLAALLLGCVKRADLRPVQPLDASPDGDFRAQPPAPLPASTHTQNATPVHVTLPNGLQLFVIERPSLPLMTIAYVNREAVSGMVGRAPGIAQLTGEALLSGGSKMKGDVVFGLELGGQTPRVYTGLDYTRVSLILPPTALEAAVGALSLVVRHPAFEAEGVRKSQLAHLHTLYDYSFTADGYSDELSMMALYGEDHPWAVSAKREGEAVTALTRDDLVAYHANVYRPSASALVVAGAVDAARVEELARKRFGDWEEPSQPVAQHQQSPEFKVQPRRSRSQVNAVLVGGDESHILIEEPAVHYNDPDIHALRLLAYVLGGSYNSRAQLRLRHNAGIAYGVEAGVSAHSDTGTFWIRTTTRNKRLGEAAHGLLDEITRVRQSPISADELSSAKAHYRASWEFPDNYGVVDYFAWAFASGQGPNAPQNARAALDDIMVEDVQRVAQAYLSDTPNFFILTNFYKTGRALKGLGAVELFHRERP